jgi:hypothetical protein
LQSFELGPEDEPAGDAEDAYEPLDLTDLQESDFDPDIELSQ